MATGGLPGTGGNCVAGNGNTSDGTVINYSTCTVQQRHMHAASHLLVHHASTDRIAVHHRINYQAFNDDMHGMAAIASVIYGPERSYIIQHVLRIITLPALV